MKISKINEGSDADAVLAAARARSEDILETMRSVAADLPCLTVRRQHPWDRSG